MRKFIIFVTLILMSNFIFANGWKPSNEIKIVVIEDLNIRDNYPKFNIWKLSYKFGNKEGVLKEGKEAFKIKSKVIGNKSEWLLIRYEEKGKYKKGWIYAGKEGKWQYIKVLNTPTNFNRLKKQDLFGFSVNLYAESIKSELVDDRKESGSWPNYIYLSIVIILLYCVLGIWYCKKTNNNPRIILGFLTGFAGIFFLIGKIVDKWN